MPWTVPCVDAIAPQNGFANVSGAPSVKSVEGVFISPVFWPSPLLIPSFDSPGLSPSVVTPQLPVSVDELSSRSDDSLLPPRSDVTFDPSVTSISPCSNQRIQPLVDLSSASALDVPAVSSSAPASIKGFPAPLPRSSVSSMPLDSKPSSDGGHVCQSHLAKLNPLSVSMSISPRHGKRVRACKLVLCDILFQHGQSVCPVQSAPVEAMLRGKRRELYYAHRDESKCRHQGCYGLGIPIVLQEGPIVECGDHSQARFLMRSVSPADSLSRRSSSKVSARSAGASSGAIPVSHSVSVNSVADPIDFSSSSGLSIPELSDCIDDGNVPSGDSFSGSVSPISQTFAQNVRAELESLSAKGAAADLSLWAKQANQEIAAKGPQPIHQVVSSPAITPVLVDAAPIQGIQNTTVSSGSLYLPPPVLIPVPPLMTVDSQPLVQAHPVVTLHAPVSSRFPKVGVEAEQMPGFSQRPLISNLIEASNLDDLAGVGGLMPRFIRRKSSPAGHHVVPDEVDAEMYDRSERDILNLKDLASWLKAEKD